MHRPVSGAAPNPDDGPSGKGDTYAEQESLGVRSRLPPQRTRFQRGSSGNPKGRPRASKNLVAVFETALNERVPVNDNGKRKKITMFQAITKQLVRKAAGGDHRTLRLVFDMWFRLHPDGKQEPSAFELMRSIAADVMRAEEEEAKANAVLDKED